MENTNDLFVILFCKFVHLLQASTQFVVKSWTPECIKSVLQFTNQIENLVSKLSQDEIFVLQEFLRSLNTIFPHLSLSITRLHLLNAVDCVIESLCSNPYLSQTNRDCIFEYCLDTSRKLPQFNKYPPELHLIPEELLMIIECRLFGSHITSLETITEVETFLDSCFALDNLYTVHLLIRLLEQSEQCGKSDTLRATIITWLFIAIQRDPKAYISLASYNPDRLRDLTLQIPDFERVILKLFDENLHIQSEKDLPEENAQPPLVSHLLIKLSQRIISIDHLKQLLLSQVNRLAKKSNSSAEFWNSILCAINIS
ncbi:hypothetical protein MN116_006960 [Schistosoma mekongi]|uniref:Uncharacterized protein n=1 Tax=Schistosoma mekongi TaxID=38744 RepID=A0AAE2D359_SCHME|nr:hypothetical protein MN116_006960 [Schistosoma mekongi]